MRCEASVCGMVARVYAVVCAVLYAVCVCCVVCVWCVRRGLWVWVWGCDAMMRESGCEAVRVAVVCGVCG